MFAVKKEKGFTLIELLVIIAIISILASIIFVAINSRGLKTYSKETRKIVLFKEIGKALDLYYLDHGYYPKMVVSFRNAEENVDLFENELKPYIPSLDIRKYFYSEIFKEYNIFPPYYVSFFYKSPSSTNYQTYGMAGYLIDSSLYYFHNWDNIIADFSSEYNGYYSEVGAEDFAVEMGQDPKYCWEKYNGSWWENDDLMSKPMSDKRCIDGN